MKFTLHLNKRLHQKMSTKFHIYQKTSKGMARWDHMQIEKLGLKKKKEPNS